MDASEKKKKKRKKKKRREATEVACPFCGESDDLYVDPGGGGHQSYVEDCAICCRPRIIHVEPGEEPGTFSVWVERGD